MNNWDFHCNTMLRQWFGYIYAQILMKDLGFCINLYFEVEELHHYGYSNINCI